jgi:TRAP transporter TAXI family solute receptor
VRPCLHGLLLGFALIALAGCARGPDEAGLQRDVQAQLDTLFGNRVLAVTSLKRQGSAPLAATGNGGPQAVVYYNAVLTFTGPYDPSDWSGLSPELIANALGATDDGVIGFGSGRIEAGSELRAYGSMIYRRTGDDWQASPLRPAAAPSVAAGGQAGAAGDLIVRLSGVVNTTPGLRDVDDAIVAEELDHAVQNIKLRGKAGEQGFVVATGPAGGEYTRFVESLRPRGAAWSVMQANTDGSVANALMIDSGEASFGLVQSDVAAAAVTGQGAFATIGPLRHVRAVAALFPEPVHVVVRADAGIASIGGLRGKRVAVGSPGSGTRQTATQVLRAHGLAPGDYVTVAARGPDEALQWLAAGRIDAVIEVVAAPWRQLVAISAQTPMTLLPLDLEAMNRLGETVPGLLALKIRRHTYGWQEADVSTLAATALLVAGSTVPGPIVKRVLDFLFENGLAAARGVSAARLSRARALAGVTIPLHDAAADYFAVSPGGAVGAPAAATP